ncbi:hypothetical protein AYO41_02905 [Verrucomicrobia bacterium SCGC AG-212-E04]|nr:hypothetical protein AYO41_02905 [Verrucomicrobia bacterium SCGC AG-212-E04]
MTAIIHFVTHEFAPFRGGGSTYVQETSNAAARLGYPVRVIAPDYGLLVHHADAAAPCPIERVPGSGRLTPAGLWSLTRALARRREVLRESPIVLCSVGAQIAMMLLMQFKGFRASRPMITMFHGSEILRFQNHPLWRRLAARNLPFTTPACSSRYVEKFLRESALYPRETPIVLAPCACPSALVESARATGDVPRRDDGKFRLLTLARLHPRKGQHLTAQALGMLPDHAKRRLRWEIYGEGTPAYRREIERACMEAGIDFSIRGAVPVGEMTAVYAGCDAYIMTSVSLPNSVEGFGITYLEASIHGRPVIAFRTGGVAEAVQDQETGLIVPEGDLPGVAKAVLRLMDEPALAAKLGQGGREFAAGFSWDTAAKILCDRALA